MKMTKIEVHDDAELYDAIRCYVAEFRAGTRGQNPTRDQVSKALKRRRTDVCVAMNRLEEAEATHAARLAALPELPQRIREAGEAMVEQIWTAANESASVAVGELRRHIADTQHRHERQMSETTQAFGVTEDELESTRRRAEAAEADLATARQEITRLGAELSRAQAKLEDRAALAALFRSNGVDAGSVGHAEEQDADTDAAAYAGADVNADGGADADTDAATPIGEPAAETRKSSRKTSRSGSAKGGAKEEHLTSDEAQTGILPGFNSHGPAPAEDSSS